MPIDSQILYKLAEEQLAAGERVWMAFSGVSMLPTLHASDTILLEPLAGEPRVGDVLLFHNNGQRVVHRLIATKGDTYILQGDHNIGTEVVHRADLLARLVRVKHRDGRVVEVTSRAWRMASRLRLTVSASRRLVSRWFGPRGRKQLRPWYFAALVFLMWAPLNGVGIPLDNYILGLRADHLLHASVYIPCTLFLWDLFKRKEGRVLTGAVWAVAVAIGLLTEWGQYILPFRKFDINDLIANAMGVTLGWLAILIARRAFRRRSS